MGLYILLAVLAVLVIFICILLIRAALAAKKAEPIGEKPVYTTEQEDIENGERLMKMIEYRPAKYMTTRSLRSCARR